MLIVAIDDGKAMTLSTSYIPPAQPDCQCLNGVEAQSTSTQPLRDVDKALNDLITIKC